MRLGLAVCFLRAQRLESNPFMRPPQAHPRALITAALAAALTAGCTTLKTEDGAANKVVNKPAPAAVVAAAPAAAPAPAPAPVAPAAAASATTPPTATAAPGLNVRPSTLPLPGSPPPFATVVKDARRIDGPLTLWQKDDKVWIELLPAQMGQPFLLSPKIKSGIGEAWVLGGLMAFPINGAGGQQVIEFVRVHNQVRMQARNTDISAKPGTPEARGLADSYSNSLLGSAAVASAPHPERNSILIEANGLVLNDIMGVGMMLQRGLRQGYGLDRSNSVVTAVRGSSAATIIETQNHYFSGSVSNIAFGAPLGAPLPSLPRYLPDTRSMLIGLHLSFAPLPETPMATRRADPRIGLFSTAVLDFTSDLPQSPRQRYVNRWRLEKKDPAAALSEPVKPITFWIDRNVPIAYRETVRSAILEWNKAFEKIGFSKAIQVEQQSDDAKFDTLDFGYASVRWMMNAEPAFGAIGPSHVDPRTGEILDADIGFESLVTRNVRALRTQVLGGAQPSKASTRKDGLPDFAPRFDAPAELGSNAHEHTFACQHASLAAEQLGYALDVLEARGDMDPDSPVAQQFVQDYVKEAIMHEVGHTLGLRHNFRASRAYTEAQLSDPEFTRANGTTGSVMEYTAVNLPSPGQTGGVPFQTALGPYDYWAIEYAYKPLAPGTTPEAERTELLRIAARSNEPQLAYGTDEDIFFGLDPETLQLDLGADPIAFAAKRLAIARDLFKRQETRQLAPDRDYAVLRRSLGFAVSDVTRAVGVLVRQIGGMRTLRDFPGSGRDPLQPVPANVQREALALITSSILSPQGLNISPALQRRLAPDYLDRAEQIGAGTDFALPLRLLFLQRAVLAYLMSDTIASRVLDGASKTDRAGDAFQLSELYQRLADEVWVDLNSSAVISGARRDLQRDHVNRLAAAVVVPASGRADPRGLLRVQARGLLSKLEAAQKSARASSDAETRAHLADSAETLRQALAASLLRLAL
jgi:hypothetical protein